MKPFSLTNYAGHIHLHSPFVPGAAAGLSQTCLVDALLAELLHSGTAGDNQSERRALLDSLLTQLPPDTLSQQGTALLDALLQAEAAGRQITRVEDLPPFLTIGTTKVVLWHGDITTLKVGAIVNAANSQLLGCFLPGHKCIDNAIHSRAGVQLRRDCDTIIRLQGHEEATGLAKITRGYNLPADYVVHTVGPIVQGELTHYHSQRLADSYRNSLEITKEIEGLRSLALCSISTGVFGYPIEHATPLAIATVANWLRENPGQLDTLVFNVFSDRDYRTYQAELEEYICNN